MNYWLMRRKNKWTCPLTGIVHHTIRFMKTPTGMKPFRGKFQEGNPVNSSNRNYYQIWLDSLRHERA